MDFVTRMLKGNSSVCLQYGIKWEAFLLNVIYMFELCSVLSVAVTKYKKIGSIKENRKRPPY